MIKIYSINGANEVGRNMFAVEVDDNIFIFDMGLQMENYVALTQDDDLEFIDTEMLRAAEAIPNIKILKSKEKKVKAILLSHAHLDHIGGVQFLAKEFPKAGVYGTEFTIKVLEKIMSDNKTKIPNKLYSVKPNSKVKIGNYTIDFIHVTHSAPQTAIIALKTKYGDIVYANDFKLDPNPVLGERTNIKALKKLNCKILFQDCLYASSPGRNGTEKQVEKEIKQLFQDIRASEDKIFITTFSSHIERLSTILKHAHILGRTPLIMGRSLAKYCEAAQETGIYDFNNIEIVKYGSQIRKKISKLKNPEKYLIITTGHQGEEKANLSKMLDKLNFISEKDIIIFSCRVIPTETTIKAREKLEEKLDEKKAVIFKDIHVSGHAFEDDIREFLTYVNPKIAIPVHGELDRMKKYERIVNELNSEKKLKNTKVLLMSPQEVREITE